MNLLETCRRKLDHATAVGVTGRVSGVRGLTVSVSDFPVAVGAGCRIQCAPGGVNARVVGFAGRETLIMPMGETGGIRCGDRVTFTSATQTVGVGEQMLGRALDGFARPIDGLGGLAVEQHAAVWPGPIEPMRRRRITETLPTGIRAIDGMLTVGRGQRMGVFSGSGIGKTMLLEMIARQATADVTVIALIGERGREVRDFIEKKSACDALARSVVIASTSDDPPLVRVQAAAVATSVAEYFRDRGCNVLLLMDSLTRLATAQREIGLAAGEPPATKGYTPSVFQLLPRLLERTGCTDAGSITAFYAVLVEADDAHDPICDAVRSVADGHVWLSRAHAAAGQYPPIDVLQSVSRAMIDLADERHLAAAAEVRRLMSRYGEVQELVKLGAYKGGANQEYDLAIAMHAGIREFMAQAMDEASGFDRTRGRLIELHRRSMRREK